MEDGEEAEIEANSSISFNFFFYVMAIFFQLLLGAKKIHASWCYVKEFGSTIVENQYSYSLLNKNNNYNCVKEII